MDRKSNEPHATSRLTENGLFVRGVVISNSARKITKKDGGILVLTKHELALQPGVAVLERFIDPTGNPEVKVEGDNVTKFPELKPFEPIAVKASRIKEVNGQLTIPAWEQVQ